MLNVLLLVLVGAFLIPEVLILVFLSTCMLSVLVLVMMGNF